MWSSWSIYASFTIVGITIFGALWGKYVDKRDENKIALIKKKQKKIYVNLYLEPIGQMRRKVPVKEPPAKYE